MTRNGFITLFCFGALVMSSCTSYHYVAPLPAVPQFEEAGDVQVQTALWATHGEIQVSASPVKNFGFTYNGFKSFKSGSRMNSFTLHGYWKMGTAPLFLTGSLGYDRGFMASRRVPISTAMVPEDHFYSSRYQTYRLGAGIYAHFRGDERRQVSLDIHYQQILFQQLTTRRERYGSMLYWEETNLAHPSTYTVVSPMLTFTLIGSRKGLFYYRQTLGANIPMGKKLRAVHSHSDMQPGAPPIYTYIHPIFSQCIFSGAFGMRLNVLEEFFNR